MVPAERTVHKKRSTRRRQVSLNTFALVLLEATFNQYLAQLSDLDEEEETAQKFGDLDFSK